MERIEHRASKSYTLAFHVESTEQNLGLDPPKQKNEKSAGNRKHTVLSGVSATWQVIIICMYSLEQSFLFFIRDVLILLLKSLVLRKSECW